MKPPPSGSARRPLGVRRRRPPKRWRKKEVGARPRRVRLPHDRRRTSDRQGRRPSRRRVYCDGRRRHGGHRRGPFLIIIIIIIIIIMARRPPPWSIPNRAGPMGHASQIRHGDPSKPSSSTTWQKGPNRHGHHVAIDSPVGDADAPVGSFLDLTRRHVGHAVGPCCQPVPSAHAFGSMLPPPVVHSSLSGYLGHQTF